MKTIYIVSWLLIQWVPIPCPNANKKNEFGLLNTTTTLSIYCTTKDSTHCERTFTTLDSANNFSQTMQSLANDYEAPFKSKIINIKISNN